MKNFILLLTALTFALTVSAQQVRKQPLIEHFTQASCAPCASQNPTMYNTLNTFGSTKYVKLTYQTRFPGFDPMNLHYPAGPLDRRAAHSVNSVPSVSLNGGATNNPNAVVTSSSMNTADMLMSDLEMIASHTYGAGRDVNVEIKVKNVGGTAITAGKTLISAMTEAQITYTAAPGTNGETEFFSVVREMYDASTGTSSTAGVALPAMAIGDSITYTFTTSVPSYIRTYADVGFAFFVEDGLGGTVLQSTSSAPIAIPNPLDVSTTGGVFDGVGAGFCDNTLAPSFTVTNATTNMVTSVDANYTVGAGAPVTITVPNLMLAQGQSTTITFPATTVPAGSNTITYEVTSLNGNNPDVSLANNLGLTGTRNVLSPTAVGTSITTTFDGLPFRTAAPANAIADNPTGMSAFTLSSVNVQGLNTNLGGFGNSDGCFRWNFFSTQNGSSQLIYEKIDLTSQPTALKSYLKWSTAYAQYSSTSSDRLEVLVSTDCGATWTTLYNQAGAPLSTTAATTTFFYAAPTQWRADSIDLTPYMNSTELTIAFRGTSDYGNNLYIDDIRTEFEFAISVDNVEAPTTSFELFPNPVNNTLNVAFNVVDATDLNISIKNALGQTVQQVANQSFLGENTLTVNTSKLAAGVYFINAVNNDRVITKRFVVKR